MTPQVTWANHAQEAAGPPVIDAHHNPLKDTRDRRMPAMPGPCGMVLFGVSGDLARRKLLPAIYDLTNRGLLPAGFALTGFARRAWSRDEFIDSARAAVEAGARTPFRQRVWDQLVSGMTYVSGDIADPEAYHRLADAVRDQDAERGTGGNRAFYLAVPPAQFAPACAGLAHSGLATPQPGAWRRVVVEKPFGRDLATSQELDAVLEEVFPPE
jgi:glucose-6-phosphate 1-dehydrogenase